MRSYTWWIVVGVSILALVLRLPGLGTFLTADEERWIVRSGTYIDELKKGHLENTFMTTHPAETLLQIAGLAIHIQAALHHVSGHIEEFQVAQFMYAAKLAVAITASFFIGLITYLLLRMWRWSAALLAGILLACEPFLVGLSQIAHLDAMLSLSLLASVLALFVWRRDRRARWVVLAAVLLGFALDTKFLTSAWAVLFEAVLIVWVTRARALRPIVLWAGLTGLTVFVLFPALWTFHPLHNNADYNSLTSAYTKDVSAIVTEEHVSLEDSTEPITPASFYVRALLARPTPLELIVSAGVIIWLLVQWKRQPEIELRLLVLYAAGFLVVISLASKRGERYGMPAFVVLPLLTGWALARVYELWPRRWVSVLIGLAIAGSVALPLAWAPYAIAYENPLGFLRPLHQQGWGEGLDEAARWLNQQPLVDDSTYIASWYSAVTSHFFRGTTLTLSSRDDDRVLYVVLYRNMQGRGNEDPGTNIWDEYKNQKPVHVVYIQGKPYVWIYATQSLHAVRQTTGELVGGQEVGQAVPITINNWSSIDIGLATYSSRHNTEDVILHVRESLTGPDIRTVTVNATQIADSAYHHFSFTPIPNSAGKTYYVTLTSPTSTHGNAITAKFINTDALPGVMLWNGKERPQSDIVYRLE